jgi:hypothetical protein
MRIHRPSWASVLVTATVAAVVGTSVSPASAATSPVSPAVVQAKAGARPALGGVPSKVRVLPRAHRLRFAAAAAIVVPDSVDLTGTAVVAGNQGSYGSCAAYAVGYSLAGWYAKTGGQYGVPFEPMYLYSQTHVNNTATGGGSLIGANLRILGSQGIAERATYASANPSFKVKPTAAQKANAANHIGGTYSVLFSGQGAGTAGIDAIKSSLAAGAPVVIGIPVYTPFYGLTAGNALMTAAMRTGPLLGYHAITAFGYSDRGLVIENSWGTGWGANGFATLAWDFVAGSVIEAYAMPAGLAGRSSVPVVTKVSSAVVLPGLPLTVSGRNFAWVDASAPDAVQLVDTTSGETTDVPVVSRTTTALTVTVPEMAFGTYRVMVTGPGGPSADAAADDVRYLAPTVTAAVSPSGVPAAGKVTISVTGGPFGTTAKAFAAHKVSFRVNGAAVGAKWVDDSTVKFVLPAGKPGSTPSIQIVADGRPAWVTGTLTYNASMSARWTVAKTTGVRTGRISGRGLLQSGSWTLTGPDGSTVAMQTVPSAATLAWVSRGVYVASDTAATVRLPGSLGAAGTWRLSFTPNAGLYPGATLHAPLNLAYVS